MTLGDPGAITRARLWYLRRQGPLKCGVGPLVLRQLERREAEITD